MNNTKQWLRAALAVAAAAGLIWLLVRLFYDAPGSVEARAAAASPDPQAGAQAAPQGAAAAAGDAYAQSPLGAGAPWLAPLPAGPSLTMESPLSTMSPPRFSADSRGRLILNSDTHANLEKLLLEEDPVAMQAALDKISAGLPAQAAAELKVLAAQFQQYTKALSHTVSPENAPENERDGLKLLDSLHTLRVSYLGAEAARAMFGAEEATTRQLIALMAADKETHLTPQQKAERAQEILSRMPPPSS
ncbi:lipase chaperone [Massilia sp. PAMC28688]|uniref:lipase chaperone n=1 Tax=Massilia sp. PAMC28688 TaxID=2861283 RepID=UPI001C624B33|nr:lipase chaperone [Massilia sp. PAMC28688]QYF92520.1 lipase chaperone [Massilia sp. PAMC28688]